MGQTGRCGKRFHREGEQRQRRAQRQLEGVADGFPEDGISRQGEVVGEADPPPRAVDEVVMYDAQREVEDRGGNHERPEQNDHRRDKRPTEQRLATPHGG